MLHIKFSNLSKTTILLAILIDFKGLQLTSFHGLLKYPIELKLHCRIQNSSGFLMTCQAQSCVHPLTRTRGVFFGHLFAVFFGRFTITQEPLDEISQKFQIFIFRYFSTLLQNFGGLPRLCRDRSIAPASLVHLLLTAIIFFCDFLATRL